MRDIVDLSVPLRAGIRSDPPGLEPEIDYLDHTQTRNDMLRFFPGAGVDDLPDGEGWAIEWVRMTTHSGTHMDAPTTTRRRWTTEGAPSPSMRCRWSGVSNGP